MTTYEPRNLDEYDEDLLADWAPPGTPTEASALIPPGKAGHNRCVFRYEGNAWS